MSGAHQLRARGKVLQAMGRDAFRVELPNGHRCVGHLPRGADSIHGDLQPGAEVTIEFHPYDLSRGRIVG